MRLGLEGSFEGSINGSADIHTPDKLVLQAVEGWLRGLPCKEPQRIGIRRDAPKITHSHGGPQSGVYNLLLRFGE